MDTDMTDEPDSVDMANTPPTNRAQRVSAHLGRGGERLTDPDRVNALSDGVFAIVLTILVLEIVVPEGLSHSSLRPFLEELRPTLVAWVISFLITGMYWTAHRDIFSRVQKVNRDLVWLNLLFLLPVSLIPFAASVLGEYPDEPLALQFYGVVMILATVMRSFLFWYVSHRPVLLWVDDVSERSRVGLAISASPIVVYALAMAVAPFASIASIVLYFSVPILYFLFITLLRDRVDIQAEADEFT